MSGEISEPPVTICVLTYGDHSHLAERSIGSILRYVDRRLYRLVVGANAPGSETLTYLQARRASGDIDHLIVSETNLWKCPMMRRMFEHVRSEFVWWFDDDSYVTSPDALTERLRIAREAASDVIQWGELYLCDHPSAFYHGDPVSFVRAAPWYRGLTPPFWEPGGKGEFDFNGEGTGDGRWMFIVGGGWFARFSALQSMDWPDVRIPICGDDVFLGEAIRQQGWQIQNIGKLGTEINAAPRRWNIEDERALAGLQRAAKAEVRT